MSKAWIPTRYLPVEDMDADAGLVEACRKLIQVERERIETCETEGDVLAARWRITAVTREVHTLASDLAAKKPIPPTVTLESVASP